MCAIVTIASLVEEQCESYESVGEHSVHSIHFKVIQYVFFPHMVPVQFFFQNMAHPVSHAFMPEKACVG